MRAGFIVLLALVRAAEFFRIIESAALAAAQFAITVVYVLGAEACIRQASFPPSFSCFDIFLAPLARGSQAFAFQRVFGNLALSALVVIQNLGQMGLTNQRAFGVGDFPLCATCWIDRCFDKIFAAFG